MWKKRIVVTGVGMVTPISTDVTSTWSALIAGQSKSTTFLLMPTPALSPKSQPA